MTSSPAFFTHELELELEQVNISTDRVFRVSSKPRIISAPVVGHDPQAEGKDSRREPFEHPPLDEINDMKFLGRSRFRAVLKPTGRQRANNPQKELRSHVQISIDRY